ncbi:MAG: beta-propeller domain-containing protein [Methanomicrobiaceae archaeon]|nr:beta-propeller domain-containing protein [Methanomicrobiaceae archaeon]
MKEGTGYRIIIALIIAGAVAVCIMAAYTLTGDSQEIPPEDYLLQITSEDELRQFLKENQNTGQYADYGSVFIAERGLSTATAEDSAFQPTSKGSYDMPVPTSLQGSDGYADSYSTTNIQVIDVDEADFVKNDGKYIYIVSGGSLIITEAYPPEDAAIISETKIGGDTKEIFINGDKLVVFYNSQKEVWVKPENSAAPIPVTNEVAAAVIYDISDPENPQPERTIEVPGYYQNSRMIGDYVYFISRNPLYGTYDDVMMPYVAEDGTEIISPDVWCPKIPQGSYVMYTITSFNVDDRGKTGSESFLLGYDNTLFVSTENVYLAYQKDSGYYRGPVFIDDAMEERDLSYQTGQKTVIHRFSIDDEKVRYAATGEVPGRLLNQYSMDEYEENLRVATTVDFWMSADGRSYNNVYVLDRDMNIRGELENLAPDESIYSARFMGDLLYLVTYKRVDPFFVIDLSNPDQPGILGKLKIPGYSDYLHPLDEKHIIGIGKATYENEWGGVSEGGVKIALFDVTDLNDPVCIDKVEIGDSGSDSEILDDHRAFLLDKRTNTLVIPITEITKNPVEGSRYEDSYSRGVWNGAYVYGISPESGFTLKGKTVHSKDSETGYYYRTYDHVKRSLFMDDILYTISDSKIVAARLNNPDETISEVELPGSQEYPYYYGGVVY